MKPIVKQLLVAAFVVLTALFVHFNELKMNTAAMWFSLVCWLLLAVGTFRWAFMSRRSRSDSKKGPVIMITIGLSYWLIANGNSTVNAQQIESPQAVIAEQTQLITLENAKKDPLLRDAALLMEQSQVDTVTQMKVIEACGVKIILVLIFISGVAYVTVKIVKACKNLGNKRQKQIDDEDSDGATNNQKRIMSPFALKTYTPGVTEFAACFHTGNEIPTLEDDADFNVQPPFTFKCAVTETGSSQPTPRVPRTTVDYTTYLLNRGLSTNDGVTSFSVNGIATNFLSEITYDSFMGIASINLSDTTNVVSVVQYSTNLFNWHDVMKLSVPIGTVFDFQNGYSPIVSRGFWRVVRQP